jgi:hypothetical protein
MNQTRSAPAIVVVAVVGMSLQLAACKPSSSSSQGAVGEPPTAERPASAVGYSACVRTHGVPGFPDPDGNGHLPKVDAQHLGVSDSQLQVAQQDCRHLLPDAGGTIDAGSIDQCMNAGDCPRALVHEVLDEERRFAQCMRSHGVPNWPDPSIDSLGRPVFAISISKLGFDPYSRRVWAKGNLCSPLMPGLPGLPAGVSP